MRILFLENSIGSALCPILRQQGYQVSATDIRILSEEIQCLDVRDLKQVEDFCLQMRPDAIMHLAAETSLELCEKDVMYPMLI
jgi:nucleoside-diphosphate-sugar epimerase